MKTFLLLIASLLIFGTKAKAQTLYAYVPEVVIEVVYESNWNAWITIQNQSSEAFLLNGNSNPPPYHAGYSVRIGPTSILPGENKTLLLDYWGQIENLQIASNSNYYSLFSASYQVPEPGAPMISCLVALLLIRRKRAC